MTTHTGKSWLILLVLAVVCAFLAYYGTSSASGGLIFHFINVSQGDCRWLPLPSGDLVLVHAGMPLAGPGVVGASHSVASPTSNFLWSHTGIRILSVGFLTCWGPSIWSGSG